MALPSRPILRVLKADGLQIFRQLQLEAALLRGDPTNSNWFVMNAALPSPAIVMGISGQPEKLLNVEALLSCSDPPLVPIIRRFSGGGTVILDGGSIMTSLICNRDAVPRLPAQPRAIMAWSHDLLQPAFEHTRAFLLHEQDYAIGDLKVGGNAQSITGDRWLHHTSFLFDFSNERLALLRHPPKAPAYRQARSHEAFMGRLKQWFDDPESFSSAVLSALSQQFQLEHVTIEEVESMPFRPHRAGLTTLTLEELREAWQRQRQAEEGQSSSVDAVQRHV